ncbi:hypothetical protein ACFYKX_20335 [Cytobacillus sp. FJAT-54145]|uniref:Lipoprotein n=1 Tax=Cytobacillus spartinae TaxID=3299023 RepID=A0ABW6KJC8_9BACI
MKLLKASALVVSLILLLTSCSQAEQEEAKPAETEITIKPYTLSEKEKVLISKTNVQFIEYFVMDGTLKENDDLIYELEIYENGELLEEGLGSHGEVKSHFDDEIISFGIQDSGTENKVSTLLVGMPGGIASTAREHEMTLTGLSKLINDKITLEKDKPVYLAAWTGTTQNSLRTIGSENGELPEGIKEAELAFVYKIMLIDEKK